MNERQPMPITRIRCPLFEQYIKPVPTPAGFTSYEIVRRAVESDARPTHPVQLHGTAGVGLRRAGRRRAVDRTAEHVCDSQGANWVR